MKTNKMKKIKSGLITEKKRQGNYDNLNKDSAVNTIVQLAVKMFSEYLGRKKKFLATSLENERFSLSKSLHEHFDLKMTSYEYDPDVYESAKKKRPSYVKVIPDNLLNHKFVNEKLFWYDSIRELSNNFINENEVLIKKADFRDKTLFIITYKRHGINNIYTIGREFSPFKDICFAETISKFINSEYVLVKNVTITMYANIEEGKPRATEMVQMAFEIIKR